MDNYTATEQAYKNGYEQGKKDAVKHGEWEPFPEDWRRQIVGGKCSLCGFCHYGNNFPYCPGCGAQMKG